MTRRILLGCTRCQKSESVASPRITSRPASRCAAYLVRVAVESDDDVAKARVHSVVGPSADPPHAEDGDPGLACMDR